MLLSFHTFCLKRSICVRASEAIAYLLQQMTTGYKDNGTNALLTPSRTITTALLPSAMLMIHADWILMGL